MRKVEAKEQGYNVRSYLKQMLNKLKVLEEDYLYSYTFQT